MPAIEKRKHRRRETGKRKKDRRRNRLERLRIEHLKEKGVIKKYYEKRKCKECGMADSGECAIFEEGYCHKIYDKRVKYCDGKGKTRKPNCVCFDCKDFGKSEFKDERELLGDEK